MRAGPLEEPKCPRRLSFLAQLVYRLTMVRFARQRSVDRQREVADRSQHIETKRACLAPKSSCLF